MVYKPVGRRHANRNGFPRFINHSDFEYQTEPTNPFFGVSPHVADAGRPDLSWQIRTEKKPSTSLTNDKNHHRL
ncbi:hypothetical protein SH501x_003005 [Pirellulaceae bacterium SH501]